MRHGQSDKRDRAAESRHDGRQQAGTHEQQQTDPFHPHAQILGITLAQQQGIERLDEQRCEQQSDTEHRAENGKKFSNEISEEVR